MARSEAKIMKAVGENELAESHGGIVGEVGSPRRMGGSGWGWGGEVAESTCSSSLSILYKCQVESTKSS